jgi:hypothetical protein
MERKNQERRHASYRGHEGRGQGSRGDFRRPAAGPDEDGGQDRPAADAIDPADAAAASPTRKGSGMARTLRAALSGLAGRVTTSHAPRGSSTAATTTSKTRGPGSNSTLMTDPAITPGRVPAMSRRASWPLACPCRQYRYSAPGVATTLYSRLVGVTAGLGVPSTLTWNGSSSTAPEIPAGVARTAMT